MLRNGNVSPNLVYLCLFGLTVTLFFNFFFLNMVIILETNTTFSNIQTKKTTQHIYTIDFHFRNFLLNFTTKNPRRRWWQPQHRPSPPRFTSGQCNSRARLLATKQKHRQFSVRFLPHMLDGPCDKQCGCNRNNAITFQVGGQCFPTLFGGKGDI